MSVAVELSSDVFEHERSSNPDPASSSDSSDDNESEGGWSDDDWVSTESERSSDEEAQSLSTISSHDSSSNHEQRSTEVQFPQNLDFRNDWNMSDVHEQGVVASPLHRMSYHERNGGKPHSIVDLIGVPERNTPAVTGLGNELDAMAFIDRRIGQNHKRDASKRFNFNHGFSGGGDSNAAMQQAHTGRPHKHDVAFEGDCSATDTESSRDSGGMEDSWKAHLSMLKKPQQAAGEGSEKMDLEASMKMDDIELSGEISSEDEEWGELSELSDATFNVALDDNSNYNQETGFFDWNKARHQKKRGKAGHKKKHTNGVSHGSSQEGFYDWAKERRKRTKSRDASGHSRQSMATGSRNASGHSRGSRNASGHSRQSIATGSSHEESGHHDLNESPDDATIQSYFDWKTQQHHHQQHHEKKKQGKKKGVEG